MTVGDIATQGKATSITAGQATVYNGSGDYTQIMGGTVTASDDVIADGVSLKNLAGDFSEVNANVGGITRVVYANGQGETTIEGATSFDSTGMTVGDIATQGKATSVTAGQATVYNGTGDFTQINGGTVTASEDVALEDGTSLKDIGANTAGITREVYANGQGETTIEGATSFDSTGMTIGDIATQGKATSMTAGQALFYNGTGDFTQIIGGTITASQDVQLSDGTSLKALSGKVSDLEENGAGISNGNFKVDENGNVTNTIKDEAGNTVSEITTDQNGLTVKDENGSTTINGSGITVGDSTSITNDGITTGNGNFSGDVNIGGKLTVGGEELATSGNVDAIRKDVGDLTQLDTDIQSDNLVGAVNNVNGKVDAVDAKVGDTSKLDSDLAVNGDKTSLVEAINAEANLRQGVANRVSGLEDRVGNLEDRMGDVEDRIDKVGAMAAAIANLRTMGYDPEAPTEIAVGVGQYESETGLALGVFHYPNQDFMLSASISTSGDEVMGGIGATWKIGRKSSAEKARSVEEKRVAKAEEMQEMAKAEKVKAQRERHAQMLAEREAAK